MIVKLAYIEEPPFYWTEKDGSVTGSDIALAELVLKAIGVTSIEYVATSFPEFLPGVNAGRWDMNVPIFVSEERAKEVLFSVPVWALGDGFLLPAGNPKALSSYKSIAANKDFRLGAVAGTVQIGAAKTAGVAGEQIVIFKDQPEAITALRDRKIDAFVGTAVGNRALAEANGGFETVAHEQNKGGKAPVGAFSFSKENTKLQQAVNDQLLKYLGSEDHRSRMAEFGITNTEIDSVVV